MTIRVNKSGDSADGYSKPPLPAMTLSGLVLGILTNRLALRTRSPRREESEIVAEIGLAQEKFLLFLPRRLNPTLEAGRPHQVLFRK